MTNHVTGAIRAASRAAGDLFYETGRPCKRGHTAPRLVSTGNCIECNRISSRAYAVEHPERKKTPAFRARAAKMQNARYWRNPEKHRQFTLDWAKRYPDRAAELVRRREARTLQATPAWANRAAMRAIYKAACDAGCDVDHIVPLRSPLVCGLHCEANLQALPPTENRRKGNRWWPDMP